MIPGTHNPAVAFPDASANCMKFAYWDGSHYRVEIVSGDYTATAIRIIFLSTGIPLVFWLSGSNLKVSVRSAHLGLPGKWMSGAIEAGSSPTVFEAAVNPLDQIGIIILSDTAVTGRARFVYCTSCTSPTVRP